MIEKALGGVLFIDEAYSITENENSDSYGRECLTELTKALEDYRDNLVVIVAGYTEPMIFEKMCKEDDYEMSSEIVAGLKEIFNEKGNSHIQNFSNGRFVRNLYENMVMNHARRVMCIVDPTLNQLRLFEKEDVPTRNTL